MWITSLFDTFIYLNITPIAEHNAAPKGPSIIIVVKSTANPTETALPFDSSTANDSTKKDKKANMMNNLIGGNPYLEKRNNPNMIDRSIIKMIKYLTLGVYSFMVIPPLK